MSIRVAVLDDLLEVAEGAAPWSTLGPEVEVCFRHERIPPAELATALRDYDVVVAMRERTPLDGELLRALPRLKLIVTTGMRNASIDLAAAQEAGIAVCGTRAGQAPAAELTWALILGLVRQVASNDRSMRDGGWQTALAGDLSGHTLGVVGLGKLGSRVARVARAFDMHVIAWSPHLTAARAAESGAVAVAKEELFSRSDIVTLHLVLSDATRGVVGEAELRAMRANALLVNTARAGLVDDEALRRTLAMGRLAGAAMDVFPEEPAPDNAWYRSEPRLLLSPHTGYLTRDNRATMYVDAVEDIAAFLAGNLVRLLDLPSTQV